VARDEVCDLLREFVCDENRAVLFSTHITSDLEKVADYITFILDGKTVYTGTRDELLEKYARITGGQEDLSESIRRRIIGLREHDNGFEGLVETAHLRHVPDSLFTEPASLFTEPASLEEIIIYVNRGGKNSHA
jgi:ABC-2 type transport system ATP-binding protein